MSFCPPLRVWGGVPLYFCITSDFKKVEGIVGNHLCIFDPDSPVFKNYFVCVCMSVYFIKIQTLCPIPDIFHYLYLRNKDAFLHNNRKLSKSGNSVLM